MFFFFFTDTSTTEIYTLSLHDALPICGEDIYRDAAGYMGQELVLPAICWGSLLIQPIIKHSKLDPLFYLSIEAIDHERVPQQVNRILLKLGDT